MLRPAIKVLKWTFLPFILIGSLFSRYATGYELQIDMTICIGAFILLQRAVGAREYFWAAGFMGMAVVFSPLLLVQKVFLLMALASLVAVFTVRAAWKLQPVPAV
jgi:hypothetical protein